jgi:hypothetical protein
MPAMSMQVALARRAAIVEFVKDLMVRDLDFGEIPGTNRPSLLKPGAEKLVNFFGLDPEFAAVEETADWNGDEHHGETFYYIRYRCRLQRDGRVVGIGEASANSWESKYRYRWVSLDQVPPHLDASGLVTRGGRISEFQFAVDRAETTGRYGKPAAYWQQFHEAIAAGAARSTTKKLRNGEESPAWEIDGRLYRVPNADVADQINTIQKMAQKRALVAATLIATSASEFFTQDVEDGATTNDAAPAAAEPEDIDTGGHAKGTRQAREHVRDRKIEQLRAKEAAEAVNPAAPSQAPPPPPFGSKGGEMVKAFQEIRSRLPADLYAQVLKSYGVDHPRLFKTRDQAVACYRELAGMAAASGTRKEVA